MKIELSSKLKLTIDTPYLTLMSYEMSNVSTLGNMIARYPGFTVYKKSSAYSSKTEVVMSVRAEVTASLEGDEWL